GTGIAGYSGDSGPATNAQLNSPLAVAVDAAGNLYIADTGNNVVRKVSSGTITTVAGNGSAGSAGDGGAATSAQLQAPSALAVDGAGALYIASNSQYCVPGIFLHPCVWAGRVRKVENVVINSVAGGSGSYIGGLAVDSSGAL